MKYDMEIVMSVVTNDERYRKRLDDYKKIGLLNVPHGAKLKIVLLIEQGTADEELVQGWPHGSTVVVKEYAHGLHIYKLCNYYMNLFHFDAKWYVGFDDDSVTDVKGLMQVLGQHSWRRPVYFSELMDADSTDPSVDRALLRRMGLLHLLNGDYTHDWEAHYISRAGLIKILKNPVALSYISERGKILSGFSDSFLTFAARLSGLDARSARSFSTPHPSITDFSLFGGPYYHIHYVAADYGNTQSFQDLA